KAFHDNLCLQLIRPALSTHASIHFDTRRQRSSYVVRRVVHYEHPCRKRLFSGAQKSKQKKSEGLRCCAYVQQLSSAARRTESCPSRIGLISLGAKQMGARSAGNPHAACDVEGTGNVARSTGLPARQSSTLPGRRSAYALLTPFPT